MSFCKDFNAKTSEHRSDVPVPVEIAIYGDKSFEWRMKTPPASYFIAKAAGVAKSSTRPGHAFVGSINLKHAYEIAKVKASDETMALVRATFFEAHADTQRIITTTHVEAAARRLGKGAAGTEQRA